MIPWVQLDKTTVPGGGELKLMRRGTEFWIMAGAITLMNSRLSGSEVALAQLACGRVRHLPQPRLLIGGLGMGFTLRAAMAELGPEAGIVVAELVPAVVAWAKGPMESIFGDCLADPRVEIHVGDVGVLMAESTGRFDAILLDVDNGPDGLTRGANDGLYGLKGLRSAWRTLNSGGVLLIWSAGPDKGFTQRLAQAGFVAEEVKVRAHGGKGARHVIWVATKGAPPAGR